jgi:putative thiamine transport system permease protein
MAEAVQPLSLRGARATGGRSTSPVLRLFPVVTLALFLAPIAAGLLGTWLPAAGYLPALGGAAPSFEPWRTLWQQPGLLTSLRLTLTSGLLATVATFGVVVLFCAAFQGTRVFRAACRGLAPLLAMPHAAVAIGLAFLVAPSGWLFRLASPWLTGWASPPDLALVQDPFGLALTVGLIIKEAPFLLLMVVGALGQVRADALMAASRSLGYGRVTAWLKAVLPVIYPQIRLPIYAVLAYALSVVDMAVVLAPSNPPTLAVAVLRWSHDPALAMRVTAGAGAGFGMAWSDAGARGRHDPGWTPVAGTVMAAVYGLSGAALAGLAVWSVAWRWRFPEALPTAWSTAMWGRHLAALERAAWTSFSVALTVALVAVVLAVGCLENEKRHGLRPSGRGLWLLYTPLLVPQIAFLFGIQVLAVKAGLDGLWLTLVWAHLLFVLPYVFLALAEPYRALDERYARTALSLGASPARVFWRIKLPMLIRPMGFAMAVGFAVSIAQYLPTVFVGSGRFATLTTEAVSLAAGADRRIVAIYAFLQALLPLIAFAATLLLPARGAIGR